MERGPFLTDKIQKAFGRFVEVALHTDGQAPGLIEHSRRNRRYQSKRFHTVALPYYVLADPSGEKIYWKRGGVLSAEEFLAALQSVPQPPPRH